MTATTTTYKMIPIFAADNYRLQDVFPYVKETGARTGTDLLEYILTTWFNGTESYPGLENWLPSMSLPAKAWAEPELISAGDRERIRVRIHVEDGRKGFLSAIQSGTWNPVFFVRPNEGNPYMTNFLLKLAAEMGQGGDAPLLRSANTPHLPTTCSMPHIEGRFYVPVDGLLSAEECAAFIRDMDREDNLRAVDSAIAAYDRGMTDVIGQETPHLVLLSESWSVGI